MIEEGSMAPETYETPELMVLGSLAELTKGSTGSLPDVSLAGSVNVLPSI